MGSALTTVIVRIELQEFQLVSQTIAWCGENFTHIWCQKYCECGSRTRVKEIHRRSWVEVGPEN